jgi:cell division protein FtsL
MAEDVEKDVLDRSDSPVAAAKSPLALPFMLTLAALTIYFVFETVQLFSERSNLVAVKTSQDGAIQEAQKIQAQFKNLVSKTSELADQGHAGAKMVMEELFQRGIGPAPQAVSPQTKPPAKPETKAGK